MADLVKYLTIGFKIAVLAVVVAIALLIPNLIASLLGFVSWGLAAILYVVLVLCGWILLGYLALKYRNWIFRGV